MRIKNESRIFVVNNSGHNMRPALKFTTLPREKAFVNLTEGVANIFDVDRLAKTIQEKMKGINKGDFLLLSGSNVLNILAAIVSYEEIGTVNMLIYNQLRKEYVLREFRKESFEWLKIQEQEQEKA